jgi:hypothetical protein
MTTRTTDRTMKPQKFPDFIAYSSTLHPLPPSNQETKPTCYSGAVKHPQWRSAMASEISALANNGTWVLVPPSPNYNIIGRLWVYKTKRKSDGTIERYKARLVAKGTTQEDGVS